MSVITPASSLAMGQRSGRGPFRACAGPSFHSTSPSIHTLPDSACRSFSLSHFRYIFVLDKTWEAGEHEQRQAQGTRVDT